jgi:hypothetical protein
MGLAVRGDDDMKETTYNRFPQSGTICVATIFSLQLAYMNGQS